MKAKKQIITNKNIIRYNPPKCQENQIPKIFITGEASGTLSQDLKNETWDNAKREANLVSWLYSGHSSPKVRRWGERIKSCGESLMYRYIQKGDKWQRRVGTAHLCRVKTCPICRWRRALKVQAQIQQRVKAIFAKKEHQSLKPVLLTLTVRNCQLSDLKVTIKKILAGWRILSKRKAIAKFCKGYVRSIEITRGKQDNRTAHPHLHAFLLVTPEFEEYLKNEFWADEWQYSCKLDYVPQVDIRPVTDTDKAIVETCKYAVKPQASETSRNWLPEVALAIDNLRTFGTAGLIKNIKEDIEDEESEYSEVEELPIVAGGKPKNAVELRCYYAWKDDIQKYFRFSTVWKTSENNHHRRE